MSRHIPIRRHAFTLVEVLVVIAMVGVLLGILLVTLGTAQDSAKTATDLSNQSQIIKANLNFSVDNKGRLFHPRTLFDPNEPNLNADASKRMWVRDSETGQIPDAPTGIEALQAGAAWEYIGNENSYRSPLDPTLRKRSYSLNSLVGVNNGADDYSGYTQNPPPNLGVNYLPCPTLSRIPQPARTMGCITEQDVDYANNWNGFLVHTGLPNVNIPQWADAPAWNWNPGRVTIGFMDGHTEVYRLSDYENLSEAVQNHNVIYDGPDYQYFRSIMLPGRIEY